MSNCPPLPDGQAPTPERLVNIAFEKELEALIDKYSVDIAAFYQCANECHSYIAGMHDAKHTISHLAETAREVKQICETKSILSGIEKELS